MHGTEVLSMCSSCISSDKGRVVSLLSSQGKWGMWDRQGWYRTGRNLDGKRQQPVSTQALWVLHPCFQVSRELQKKNLMASFVSDCTEKRSPECHSKFEGKPVSLVASPRCDSLSSPARCRGSISSRWSAKRPICSSIWNGNVLLFFSLSKSYLVFQCLRHSLQARCR